MSDVLWAEAVIGRDAKDFLASDLGRYLIGRAQQERNSALTELGRVSPWRRNRIRHLQNIVWRSEAFGGWLVELISRGREAEVVLESESDDND